MVNFSRFFFFEKFDNHFNIPFTTLDSREPPLAAPSERTPWSRGWRRFRDAAHAAILPQWSGN